MATFGFGANFGGNDNQLENFINQGFVCVGYAQEQMPNYYEIIKQIKIGDIIYIKAMWSSDTNMRLKAVGIATSEFKSENTHEGYESCKNQIDVKWIATFSSEYPKITLSDSQINERKNTVFEEHNPHITKQVIDLI